MLRRVFCSRNLVQWNDTSKVVDNLCDAGLDAVDQSRYSQIECYFFCGLKDARQVAYSSISLLSKLERIPRSLIFSAWVPVGNFLITWPVEEAVESLLPILLVSNYVKRNHSSILCVILPLWYVYSIWYGGIFHSVVCDSHIEPFLIPPCTIPCPRLVIRTNCKKLIRCNRCWQNCCKNVFVPVSISTRAESISYFINFRMSVNCFHSQARWYSYRFPTVRR